MTDEERQEVARLGGKARAKNMTAKQRRDSAIKASRAAAEARTAAAQARRAAATKKQTRKSK